MVKKNAQPWTVNVLTLFPEMFPGPLGHSLSGKALDKGLWNLKATNIRDFATDVHRTVDDAPFGGGAGMVLKPEVLDAALLSVAHISASPAIYLSPRGKPLTQKKVEELTQQPGCTLICGRYEGVDERFLVKRGVEELSIGDYILSGGELAAMVLIDSCVRLIPGVMGKAASGEEESFSKGLLEYPHYTRPQEWEGLSVPDVLLSGHHKEIENWRLKQSEEMTKKRRPDLWKEYLKYKSEE
jgi:tRNA (guanine37-N1)-methyltransferase